VKLLVIDTETTGLDPNNAKCVEVAASLFAVKDREVLQSVSFLMPVDSNPAQHINRIDPAITQYDQPWRTALALFIEMLSVADAAVAHNAAFDRRWFGRGHLPNVHLPWICTMEINWPTPMPGRGLKDLALSHGLTITPDHHRAMHDVHLLTAVLSRRDDLEELIEDALRPRTLYQALVPFARKDEAKERGFRWEAERKRWVRRLALDELASLPFSVAPVV